MSEKTTVTLASVASTVKKIARDTLRMGLIAARQSKIVTLNAGVKEAEKHLVELNKAVARTEYQIAKLDKADPDYEDKLKSTTEVLTEQKKEVARYETRCLVDIKAETTEAIAKQNDGIAKIESGETKVCAEALADLTDTLFNEIALESVRGIEVPDPNRTEKAVEGGKEAK